MSFILDALKKLEQNKQDASVPDLLTVHTAEQYETSKKPLWPKILIALLLLNAGIVSYWMLSDKTEEVVVAEPDITETQQQSVKLNPVNVLDNESPDDRAAEPPVQSAAVKETTGDDAMDKITDRDQKLSTSPIPEDTQLLEKEQNEAHIEAEAIKSIVDEETPIVEQLIKEASGKAQEMADLQSEEPENTDAEQASAIPSELHPLSAVESEREKQLPSFSELPEDIRKEIPDLTIIAHIYSNNPSSRMVNINGDVLREGETLSGKLKVEEITISGVTFHYKAHLFRLRAF